MFSKVINEVTTNDIKSIIKTWHPDELIIYGATLFEMLPNKIKLELL
jgi:hypothetical protein